MVRYTGLLISPSGTSELDCATTKTDTAERSISIGRESLKVFFVLGALAYLQVPPLGVVVTKNGVHSDCRACARNVCQEPSEVTKGAHIEHL